MSQPANDEMRALRAELEATRRRAERVTLINHVAHLMSSSLSYENLFPRAVGAIRATFGFSYLSAGIVDPENEEWLLLLAQAGTSEHMVPAGYRHSIHSGLVGEAARERRQVLVNNVQADGRFVDVLGDPAICAELVVPIIVGERLLGVLNIESHRAIDAEEAESIAAIADQFGVALENARLFGETQRALDTTRLLFAVSQRLGTAMSVEQVSLAYLEEVAARGRYVCTLALYERDADERPTAMQLCGVWSPDGGVRQIVERIPYSPDALDGPLDAGETVTIRDIHSDLRALPELRAIQQRDGRPALAFIPLLARGRRIGLVILSYPQPHNWPADTLRLYQTTAAQLASAIDSRQQHRLLAERSQQVAVLEERRRLARELHDSVTQSLFSMSLLSQVIPDLWQADRAEALDALSQIRDLTRGALTEMRELLYELRPADSGEQDLAQALRAHCGAFARRSGLNLRCDLASPLIMPAGPAQALLRIAQEALTNIDHHASARQVEVVLRAGPPARLRIADDGRGFTPEHVAAGRLGLILMRERAAAIGAALDIRSAPGQGTEVQISWGALMGAAEGGL